MGFNINPLRRRITQKLTAILAKDRYINKNSNIKSILVVRPNHRLGNILLITPLIEELVEMFPGVKIDLFVKGKVAEIVFAQHPNSNTIISLPKSHFKKLHLYFFTWIKLFYKKYDLVVNAFEASSSGRIATKISRSKFKFYGKATHEEFKSLPNYEHLAKNSVYHLRSYLLKTFPNLVFTDVKPLCFRLESSELLKGKELLFNIFNNHKKTICFFTFATGDKCYDKVFWKNLYNQMQNNFGTDFNLLEILPVENCSQIDFASKNFYSKDIREIASVLQHAVLFIGADSGMMHLASSVTNTIGLFEVTILEKYQPYGRLSLGINTKLSHQDDILLAMKKIVNNYK